MNNIEKDLNYILEHSDGDRDLDENEFRCSESWMCARRLALKRLQPDQALPLDETSKNVFFWGRAGHTQLQTRLMSHDEKYWGAEYEIYQVFITELGYKYHVSGHIDLRYGQDHIIEIKTINPYAMGHILERGKPNDHHVIQANYMSGFFEVSKHPIILYVSKGINSKSPKTFYLVNGLQYDRILFKKVEQKFDLVMDMLLDNSIHLLDLPLTEFEWECNYCEMRKLCKKLGKPNQPSINPV